MEKHKTRMFDVDDDGKLVGFPVRYMYKNLLAVRIFLDDVSDNSFYDPTWTSAPYMDFAQNRYYHTFTVDSSRRMNWMCDYGESRQWLSYYTDKKTNKFHVYYMYSGGCESYFKPTKALVILPTTLLDVGVDVSKQLFSNR